MDFSLSVVWAGVSLKSTNFGVSPKTELLAKFTLSHGLMSVTSAETDSTRIAPLKYDVECSFTAGNPLMKASNGSAFLPLLAVPELIGLKISLFPIRVGETDVAMNDGLPQLSLDLVLEGGASIGVARSLSVPITFPVVQKFLRKGAPRPVGSPKGEMSGMGSSSLASASLQR